MITKIQQRNTFSRIMLAAVALILSACTAPQATLLPRDPATQLTLAGAPVPPAALLEHMTESPALGAVSDSIVYESIDDVRALEQAIAAGQIHAGMASTSALAVLRNQGLPIQMVDVFGWNLLHMIVGEKEVNDWESLRGSKVAVPYRGSVSDVIFLRLAAEAGLDLNNDLVMRYASNPLEAAEVLMGKQVQAAVLGEPWASVAIAKGVEEDEPIHRTINLQTEWGALLGSEPRIPQVGFFVTDALAAEHPEIVAALHTALSEAAAWAAAEPSAAANAAATLTRLSPEIAGEALINSGLNVVSAREARPELELLFQVLADANPDLVGGKLPDEGFYGGGE